MDDSRRVVGLSPGPRPIPVNPSPWERRYLLEAQKGIEGPVPRLDPAREITLTDVLLFEVEQEIAKDAEEQRISCAAARDMLDNPERCHDRAGIARDVATGRWLRASAIRRWAIRVHRSISALIRPRPEMRRKRRAF